MGETKFLGFFKLETGGAVIGHVYFVFGLASFLSFLSILGQELVKILEHFVNNQTSYAEDYLGFIIFLVITMLSLYIVYASVLLIRGCKKRKGEEVTPAMVLFFLQSILVWGLLFFGFYKALIVCAVNLYVFTILHSLWEKFEAEKQEILEIPTSGISQQMVSVELINENSSVPHSLNHCNSTHATAPPSYTASTGFQPMSKH